MHFEVWPAFQIAMYGKEFITLVRKEERSWFVAELLQAGSTQTEAAKALGVSQATVNHDFQVIGSDNPEAAAAIEAKPHPRATEAARQEGEASGQTCHLGREGRLQRRVGQGPVAAGRDSSSATRCSADLPAEAQPGPARGTATEPRTAGQGSQGHQDEAVQAQVVSSVEPQVLRRRDRPGADRE